MKRLRLTIAWALVCAVLVLLMLIPEKQAGLLREEAVRSRYDGWSGVLRLWTCEGWASGGGSLTPWLSECVSAFEKSHNGVYIQVTQVSAESLRGFADGSVNPPDMVLFAPGMLTSGANLMALDESYSLREGLEETGLIDGRRYAVPVALGAYAIGYNRAMLRALPADWGGLSERPEPVQSARKARQAVWLSWPCDGEWQSWSAALIALLSGTSEEQLAGKEAPAGEGIDLGLPPSEPTSPPASDQSVLIENSLPVLLGDDFRHNLSVYADFTGLRAAAMGVTQREIRRLQLLDDTGKAPDWAVGACGEAFTDQIALLAVTDCERSHLNSRQTLCADFVRLLVSPERQQRLTRARALPVTDENALYAGQSGMAQLESSLSGRSLIAPPAFDNAWRDTAARLADQMQNGSLSPAQAFERLASCLRG